jgi:hypothetical protein
VEILISRGSAYKIVTESGTILPKKPNLSASKFINELPFLIKELSKIGVNLQPYPLFDVFRFVNLKSKI